MIHDPVVRWTESCVTVGCSSAVLPICDPVVQLTVSCLTVGQSMILWYSGQYPIFDCWTFISCATNLWSCGTVGGTLFDCWTSICYYATNPWSSTVEHPSAIMLPIHDPVVQLTVPVWLLDVHMLYYQSLIMWYSWQYPVQLLDVHLLVCCYQSVILWYSWRYCVWQQDFYLLCYIYREYLLLPQGVHHANTRYENVMCGQDSAVGQKYFAINFLCYRFITNTNIRNLEFGAPSWGWRYAEILWLQEKDRQLFTWKIAIQYNQSVESILDKMKFLAYCPAQQKLKKCVLRIVIKYLLTYQPSPFFPSHHVTIRNCCLQYHAS